MSPSILSWPQVHACIKKIAHCGFWKMVSCCRELEESPSSSQRRCDQKRTFTFAFWLVSRVSVVPVHIAASPSPTYFINPQIKSLQFSDQTLLALPSLWRGNELIGLFASHPSLSSSDIYLHCRARQGFLPETATVWPSVMEGKMPLFHVPVSLGSTKTLFPHIHFCSTSEPSTTRACKNRSATEKKHKWPRALPEPNVYAFILMCRRKRKYTCALYLCPCQVSTQIILAAHV